VNAYYAAEAAARIPGDEDLGRIINASVTVVTFVMWVVIIVGRADVYENPDAIDPVLSRDIVRDLAGRFLSDGDVPDGFEVDESGGEARAYLLGDGVVVKTQRPHRRRPRTSLGIEAGVLDLLARPLGDWVPRLLGYGTAETHAGPVEFLVMSRITGRAVVHQPVSGAQRDLLAARLAGILRRIHATDPREVQGPGPLPEGDDGVALHRRLRDGFADLADAIAEHPDRWMASVSPGEVASAALAALPATLTQPPVLLHSNPGPTHVFVDETGSFTGVIDFGDAYVSHPALDLRSWPDPADRVVLRDAYVDGRPVSAEFEAVWTVAMIYADMTTIVRQLDSADRAERDLAMRLSSL
jgi:hygromycin-B 7''-O-kinase